MNIQENSTNISREGEATSDIVKERSQEEKYVCYYLDHTFIDPKELAVLSGRIKRSGSVHFKNSLLVCTCHRIEAYFPFAVQEDPIEVILGIRARSIMGKKLLERRLTAIACGIESVILGEKFIYHQVAQAINDLPDGHVMRRFGSQVLSRARQIRKRNNFFAADDYEGISLCLIEKWANRSEANTLVIVGAGMLSLQVARFAGSRNYGNVIMVSRVAKKIRKKHRDNPYQFRICSVHTLPETLFDSPFDCFIATTNIQGAYQEQLFEIIAHDQCQSIIDMSSIPAFQQATVSNRVYITMYDSPFLNEVGRSNQKMLHRRERVQNEIHNVSGDCR